MSLLKIYGPLYLALAVVKKRKLNAQTLKPVLNAVLRTSTFVSLLGPGSLVINCLAYNVFKRHYRFVYFLAGAIPAFIAVLVERYERRREITIFMISIILEQLWRMGTARGFFKAVPFGEVIVFSAAMAVMNYIHTFERDCIGNSELPMKLIVGDKEKPDLVESTLQKLAGLSARTSNAVHVVTGAMKGFLIGFCIRMGQWLLGMVLRGGKSPKGKTATPLIQLLRQASRIGAFLALLSGGNRALTAAFESFKVNKRVASAIAGAVSGASAVFYPSTEIALYLVAKTCEASVKCANKYKLVPWPLSSRHFEKVFFAAEIGIGYYGVNFENTAMRRSFWNFLLNISNGRLRFLPLLSEMGSAELGYPLFKP